MESPEQLLSRTISRFFYCPGKEKQQIRLEVCYEDDILIQAHTFMLERKLMHIHYGLGAGSLFPPYSGTWKMIRKPEAQKTDTLVYEIEVSSVSPEFWIPVAYFLSIGFVSVSNIYVASKSVAIHSECVPVGEVYDKKRLIDLCTHCPFVFYQPIPFAWAWKAGTADSLVVCVSFEKEIDEYIQAAFSDYVDAALDHVFWAAEDDMRFEADPPAGGNEIRGRIIDTGCSPEMLIAAVLNCVHCFHMKTTRIQSVHFSQDCVR